MRNYERLLSLARGEGSRDFEDALIPRLGDALKMIVVIVFALLVAGTVAFLGFDIVAISLVVYYWGSLALWSKLLSIFGLVLLNGSVLGFAGWLRLRGS